MPGEDGERLAFQGRGAQQDGERLVAFQGPRGAQGNQGNQGERGATGLSVPVRRALVVLFVLSVALAAANLFWTAHEAMASQAAVQAAQVREQAAQQHADAVLSRKLCATFGKLAALDPPPGQAYEQSLRAVLGELGPDLRCAPRAGSG